MFIAFAIAMVVIALIERGQRSVRWAAAGFGFAGLAMIADVYRAIDDDLLGYVAVLMHFASIGSMMQALTLRHRQSMPLWIFAIVLVAALWMLPGTAWRPEVPVRRVIVHAVGTLILGIGVLRLWRFRQNNGIDMAITFVVVASFLSYIARTTMPIIDPPTADVMGGERLEQGYVVFAHMTSAILGLALAILLLLAVGQDLLRWRTKEARTDQLTGIGNRREMERIMTADQMGKRPIRGVIAIDLDHFKQVNDRYGHAAGDRLLAEVGKLLRYNFGHLGPACRVGGEEFILFLNQGAKAALADIAEDIRQSVRDLQLAPPLGSYRASASLGYCDHKPGADMEATLRCADRAVYAAKAAGRNQIARSA
ncbi:GGDEF domain-containing protein [Sphingomicrobium flavum]|uniref:GGDEF domain-containing protein n=1 Tax=Sphingomicrobium flavum TaxID=1229164 RepID=UPI0021AD6DB4|nr:diguanylate cyclase [Sphingomicrobium flavum]